MQKHGEEAAGFAIQPEDGSWRVEENTVAADLRDRTTANARRIIRLDVTLTKDPLPQIQGKQLLRSGTSAGANYRECCRGPSKAEFIAKLGDCLRELDDSAYRLELIATEKLIPAHLLGPLCEETPTTHLYLRFLSEPGQIPEVKSFRFLHSAF